ncbi:MAG: hypothetical protein GF416_01060 [Candidatus Altiarchaeales archaeon]|nr:hypothetical protein [Candidatus Altiarchaeales archaeon]MBD3415705.1 hypothetical protein [Candidatus Altiarchaeales archaeon]
MKYALVVFAVALASFAFLIQDRGEASEPAEGERFTIVVLPDTQFYSEKHPMIFSNQTGWIADQADEMNIAFVIHLGDIVQHASSLEEWLNANESMSLLDGKVRYSVLPGNHDMPTVHYNNFFPPSRFEAMGGYGNFTGNENSYHLFTAGGTDYLILSLAACPSDEAITWGNRVLAEHRGRRAVVATHAYMDEDGNRKVHTCGDMEYLWEGLVEPNENVFMALSGHVHGEGMLKSRAGSREVIQLLSDYQSRENGGDGYLRIMEFTAGGEVRVSTYSPYLGRFEDDGDSSFGFSL